VVCDEDFENIDFTLDNEEDVELTKKEK